MSVQSDANPGCPPHHLLNQLASGISEDKTLTSHVRGCAACRAVMDQIRADDEFLRNFATIFAGGRPASSGAGRLPQIPGYDLAHEISRGKQGVVFKATQRSTRRTVAIKVIRGSMLADALDRLRFEREVKILAKLDNPHIVSILDSGFADDAAYLVMEYIGGHSLAELIAERGKPAASHSSSSSTAGTLTSQSAQKLLRVDLELFAKICEAVDAAHLRGIIHRDIKPGNIRVDERGEPRVLDFGLAKLTVEPMDAAATMMSNVIVGTPAYASPEQLGGHSDLLDVRTDVFSLGVVLYELLTGRLPFEAKGTVFEIAERVRNTEPTAPRLLRRDIDEDLSTILLRCLQKDPERRYRNAGDLARDVRRYLAGDAIDARRDSTWYVIRKTVGRHRNRLIGAALAVGIFVGMLFLWQRDRFHAEKLAMEKELRRDAELARDGANKAARKFFTTTLSILGSLYGDEQVLERAARPLAPLLRNSLIPALNELAIRVEPSETFALRIVVANCLAATGVTEDLLFACAQLEQAGLDLERFQDASKRASWIPDLHVARANICRYTLPPDLSGWCHEYRRAIELSTTSRGATDQRTIQLFLNMGTLLRESTHAEGADWWLGKIRDLLSNHKIGSRSASQLAAIYDQVAAELERQLRGALRDESANQVAEQRERFRSANAASASRPIK